MNDILIRVGSVLCISVIVLWLKCHNHYFCSTRLGHVTNNSSCQPSEMEISETAGFQASVGFQTAVGCISYTQYLCTEGLWKPSSESQYYSGLPEFQRCSAWHREQQKKPYMPGKEGSHEEATIHF